MSAMDWAKTSSFPRVYEELNVPGFFAAFADALLDVAELRAGERLLDVGTGTGIVLRRACERQPGLVRTTGLDLNPAMLEVARDVSSEAIEYVQGDALSLPFEDGTFDVVTCQQAVQFFPDRPQALREFRRVLGAGGRAVIACWAEIDASPGYRAIADAMAEDLPDLVGAARNPFALHDPEVLRELMESAGFSDIGVQRVGRPGAFASASEFARSYVAGSALATSLADHPDEVRDRLVADIVDRVTDLAGDGTVSLPLVTNIAVGFREAES